MTELVGYRLIDLNGTVFETWGGTYGQCPAVPNPLILPSGEHVCAAQPDVNYFGYILASWTMSDPQFYEENGVKKSLPECKAAQISIINHEAFTLLEPTDWYSIRASEPGGTAIPPDILAYRRALRSHASYLKDEVNALTGVDEVVAWKPHDWPVL